MSENIFKKEWIRESPYPADFIPSGGEVVESFDKSNGKETTVKGFYKYGELHIQEVIKRNS